MNGDRVVVLRVDRLLADVSQDQQKAYLDSSVCGRILAVQLIQVGFAGTCEIGFQSKRDGLMLSDFLPSSLLREEPIAVDWPCDLGLVPVVRFPFHHPAIKTVFTFLFWVRLES